MWTIFKVFIQSVATLLSSVLFFFVATMWDLTSQAGIQPASPVLEGEVLTTESP